MTLDERAKEIGISWEGDCEAGQILADKVLSALQYAQAEAYAKAAKRVEQLSYDIRSLAMGDKP